MSKNKSQLQNKPTGELVGITKISQRLFDYMTSYAEEKFEHTLFYDYETGALVDSSKEIDIDCILVDDLIWAEIDDPDHLKRAIDLIYPMIKSNE
jgi:2-aminoethylphosphonate-pyruvate transaminase